MSEEERKIEIRPLAESDIPAAMRLKAVAGWNQTEDDWRRLRVLEPEGCFVALLDGQVVATTTTTRYGSKLAWVGMVLVDPEHRRRGIATLLMQRALDYLRAAKAATIKLDATRDGRPVYEKFGFEVELLVERWTGIARAEAAAHCAPLNSSYLSEIIGVDCRAFGADRADLLRHLIDDAYVSPLMAITTGGSVGGFVLARRGTAATYVGPLIAQDESIALTLLAGMLNQLAGQKIYLDVNTTFPGDARAHLSERGLVKQRDLLRMRLGEPSSAGTSPAVFAIAGPEIG